MSQGKKPEEDIYKKELQTLKSDNVKENQEREHKKLAFKKMQVLEKEAAVAQRQQQ